MGNEIVARNYQDNHTFARNVNLNEEVDEVHQCKSLARGLAKGIKLEFPRFRQEPISLEKLVFIKLLDSFRVVNFHSHFIWMRKHLFDFKIQVK